MGSQSLAKIPFWYKNGPDFIIFYILPGDFIQETKNREIDAKLLIWQLWKCGKDHKDHKSSLFSYQKHKRKKHQVITFIAKKLLNKKYVIMFRLSVKKHVEKC